MPDRRFPPWSIRRAGFLFALILNARHAASDKTRWVRCAARGLKSLVSLTRILTRPRKTTRHGQITTFFVAFLVASKTRRGKEWQR